MRAHELIVFIAQIEKQHVTCANYLQSSVRIGCTHHPSIVFEYKTNKVFPKTGE